MRSLATKVSFGLAALFIVAFIVIGAIATRNSIVEAQALAQNASQLLRSAALVDVQRLVNRSRNLAGVQSVLEQDAKREGRGLVLLDMNGRLVASSDPSLTHASLVRTPQGLITIDLRYGIGGSGRFERLVLTEPLGLIRSRGRSVAQLYPLPQPLSERLLAASNRRFLIALTVVGVVTLLCGYLLAQHLLDPIRRLTRATERLRMGSYEKLHIDRDDELGDLACTFNALTDELQRASRQRKELIADLAHELRSPLTNIRCAIEEMQDVGRSVTAADLESVREDVLQLQYLIADLHDLSMADAHALRLQLAPLELTKLVVAALQGFSQQFNLKGLHLTTRFPDADVVVSADGARVRQILANLLSNAIRTTPVDGTIVVSVTREDDVAAVLVQDSGPGFNPAHGQLIFERFFREEPSRSRQTGGSGLGLAVCRQLVLALGGRIHAENTENGARFTFTLPLAERAALEEAVL
ncbi:MAG: HAMP domain-containing protein [Candidatus Eremiobacteraeota bacterium]|nr:HAMP domain-containing protein [Candidatus Eremiobacteraeota bacterium]MBV9737202.1 HAMP domain-containing protein [Candidatus Eremiobacteraeota bacterium]